MSHSHVSDETLNLSPNEFEISADVVFVASGTAGVDNFVANCFLSSQEIFSGSLNLKLFIGTILSLARLVAILIGDENLKSDI